MALRDVEELELTGHRARLKMALRWKDRSRITLTFMAFATEWVVLCT